MVVAAVTRRLELRVQANLLAARGLVLLAEPAQLDVHALKLGVHPQPAQLLALVSVEGPKLVVFTEALLGLLVGPLDLVVPRERHLVALLLVGDAFARPLVDELEASPRDLGALRFVMTGGAILSPAIRSRLLTALPQVRVLDVLGSSETGRHGVGSSTGASEAEPGVFAPSETTVVLDHGRRRPLTPGDDADGWLAQRGRVPLGYLGDREKTEATFPRIDGVVHAVAGDRARLRADGKIELLGRESVTINTGGEKVHAEEVEQVLKGHETVYDALVVGRPSARWGQEVIAVVAIRGTFDDEAVTEHAATHLARYKLPKDYVLVDEIRRSASGKPDYAWAKRVAVSAGDT